MAIHATAHTTAKLGVAAQPPVCGLARTTATLNCLQDSPQPSSSSKQLTAVLITLLHSHAVALSSHLGHHLGRRRPQQISDQLQLVHHVPAGE